MIGSAPQSLEGTSGILDQHSQSLFNEEISLFLVAGGSGAGN